MDTTEELTKVRQNLAGWVSAFNDKNADALFDFYDPESIYANATAPLMRGIAEIRPWYEKAFKMISGDLLYREEDHFIAGDIAALIGAYYFKPHAGITLPEGLIPTGRVVLIYRRNDQGDWKLLFDMDNSPPDVTPELFA